MCKMFRDVIHRWQKHDPDQILQTNCKQDFPVLINYQKLNEAIREIVVEFGR